mgnify:CR=1 FL=1
MRERENIPVVLAADQNYIDPLLVTIGSILISASVKTRYEIIILTDDALNEQRIYELGEKFGHAKFTIIRMDNQLLNKAHIQNEGLSAFTYIRLFIPTLLPEYTKCIYLDTDLVVLDDLTKLYEMDIEQFYVAGVKDYGIQTLSDKRIQNSLEIHSMSSYINAGVLLYNLEKIRRAGVDKQFLGGIGKKWFFEDQDIINKYCYGRIGFLPLRYNVLYRYYQKISFIEEGFYPQAEMQEAQKQPAVLHFTGRDMKPWKFTRSRAAKHWWKFAKEVLSSEEYRKMQCNAEQNMQSMSWDYIIEKCKCKEVVIWGFSDKGMALYDALKNADIPVVCFGDNNEEKNGQTYRGTEVVALQELLSDPKVKEYLFVISSQAFFGAIEKQLRECGINNIIRYFHKNEFYYMALDEQYFGREVAEIRNREKLDSNVWDARLSDRYWMKRWLFYQE